MRYRIENEQIRLEVLSLGAEMCSIQKKDGTEYMWQGDPATWEQHAPTLFPYVGRLYDKKYQYGGQEYSMDIHGFAQKMEFVCEKIRQDYLMCYIEDSEETRKVYPFAFRFEVHYELSGSTVRIFYIVKNREGKTMYFGVGGHPGFRVPIKEQEQFEDYYLQFPEDAKPYRSPINGRGFGEGEATFFELQEGSRLGLRHDLFDEDAIVLEHMGQEVQLCGPEGPVVAVRYPQMPYLGIWHWVKTQVNYVCIEPWSSLPSREYVTEKFEEKPDLIGLEAYGTYSNCWEIVLL